jgi:hypothetical protein
MAACAPGFADCNGSNSDGCEANINTSTTHCGRCNNACASGQTCTNGACVGSTPTVCSGGVDTLSGRRWVVCLADSNRAVISHNEVGQGGQYRATQICLQLGYNRLGRYSGTCANTCGYCRSGSSCTSYGPENFNGGGECGSDQTGQILCNTVMWECLR